MEPDGAPVGAVNEDFAIESNAGDIFQLGNTSWRILKVEPGIVRVADAKGQPPTLPFWTGESPARTAELSRRSATSASSASTPTGSAASAVSTRRRRRQVAEYVSPGARRWAGRRRRSASSWSASSTRRRHAAVVHAPFGGRINRAWGLALRKRFCVGFGFELQAAANEEAIILSLGPQHSFPLDEVFELPAPQYGPRDC
jgi:ATP-dependent Lhr-like helicase